jgi:hypothetical protein
MLGYTLGKSMKKHSLYENDTLFRDNYSWHMHKFIPYGSTPTGDHSYYPISLYYLYQ